MFTACSETEVLDQNANQQAIENQGGVKFDVYTSRAVTRGGTPNDITNDNIGKIGFGVFAYYTAGDVYSTSATPNFMYNQKVWTGESPATTETVWKYEPVKYWPNEYGDAAISDEVDKVSFFSYAPWTEVEPTTGEIVPKAKPEGFEGTDAEWLEHEQKKNIISVNKNTATGDPIVKYVVDTDPATSVDLLWGVAAQTAPANYTPIDGKEGSKKKNAGVEVKPGLPFIDLVKPNDPAKDKLVFNLKHALAKVRVTIDYIADKKTPAEGTGESTLTDETEVINADETRIWVRQFNIEGWAGEGALNLNNTDAGAGVPLWKDIDGVKDINFTEIIYQDGLKDGSEGAGKIDKGETQLGLNPNIIEDAELNPIVDKKITKFGRKNPGVGAMTANVVAKPLYAASTSTVQTPSTGLLTPGAGVKGTTLLFGGDPTKNGGYFYVIPRNSGDDVNVKIIYDVETIDPNLAGVMSDGVTKGTSTENVISKNAIFGTGVDFEPGKQYDIHIHLGMTSVKIVAEVQPWVENGETTVNLPDNQNPDEATAGEFVPAAGSVYNYQSFFDKDAGLAVDNGTVETTGNFKGSYVEVKVTGSTVPSYVNQIFFVPATAKTDGTKTQLYRYNADDKILEATGIWVTIGTGELSRDMLKQAMINARGYVYDPAYTYKGEFGFEAPNTLNYTINSDVLVLTDPTKIGKEIMDDFARILGGLYRGNQAANPVINVNKIEFKGTTYTWKTTPTDLKGSNWRDASDNTLVSVLVAEFKSAVEDAITAGSGNGSTTIKINGTEITVNLTIE